MQVNSNQEKDHQYIRSEKASCQWAGRFLYIRRKEDLFEHELERATPLHSELQWRGVSIHPKLLQRGIELLILRLGVPIACIGLLDSDYGLFQGYMQLIFRTLFASVLQICLFSISLKLVVDADLFSVLLSIAFLYTAYSGPSLLQQILIPGGRGGVSSAIHAGSSGVHLAKSIRSLIGK